MSMGFFGPGGFAGGGFHRAGSSGLLLPAPSSRWRFNGNGTDDKGVANLTFGAGVTANADNYHIDNTQADQHFTTANGTYYNVGAYTALIFFKYGTSPTGSLTMWRIGNAATDNAGNNGCSIQMSGALAYKVNNVSNTTTTVTTGSLTTNTTDMFMVAVTYNPVTDGTSEMNAYFYNVSTGASATANSTTAVLQKQVNTYGVQSKAIGGVSGRDVLYYDMRIWDGTVLTSNQIQTIRDAGSEA